MGWRWERRARATRPLHHATSRVQFGKPIGAFQLVQPKLVEMAIAVNAGSLMAQQLGRLKDAGQVTFEQVSMTKLHNARAALTIAREARSLLGRPVSPPR
ncbi:MAG TPA: acyl-CoA dehydrogenase family protein [Actinomycetota bacterium]|nr:acyl-CoA dehydrogenase family protein [Actinomycetota bacterium]